MLDVEILRHSLCDWFFYVQCSVMHKNNDNSQTSDLSGTLEASELADHSDVAGASPVGAAPTTSSFST